MTNLEIKNLVNYNRFPEKDRNILLTLLYLPVGLVLLLSRCLLVFIFFILGQILPNTPPIQSFLSSIACLCFGIIVSVENCKKKENVEVFISNSLSVFDHVAITKAIGTVLPLNRTPLQSLPACGTPDLGSMNNTSTFKRNLDAVIKDRKTPVLVCPEESSTNGKALLKFNSKYFKFFEKVQPLCITIKRPVLNIAISTLGSTYMNDIIYFMFSPFTNYNIKFLPSMDKKSLSDDEFADVVRQNIATELKIEATPFSSSEVSEWSKRRLDEQRRRTQEQANAHSSLSRFANPQVLRMASQVKEVLPHVPLQAIYNDLAVTRSVDTTITNILEGRVRFTPETRRSTAPEASTSSQLSASLNKSPITGLGAVSFSQLHTAASTFGKNASERTRSFQERKELLIAAARRRYVEKHNLDIPL